MNQTAMHPGLGLNGRRRFETSPACFARKYKKFFTVFSYLSLSAYEKVLIVSCLYCLYPFCRGKSPERWVFCRSADGKVQRKKGRIQTFPDRWERISDCIEGSDSGMEKDEEGGSRCRFGGLPSKFETLQASFHFG